MLLCIVIVINLLLNKCTENDDFCECNSNLSLSASVSFSNTRGRFRPSLSLKSIYPYSTPTILCIKYTFWVAWVFYFNYYLCSTAKTMNMENQVQQRWEQIIKLVDMLIKQNVNSFVWNDFIWKKTNHLHCSRFKKCIYTIIGMQTNCQSLK